MNFDELESITVSELRKNYSKVSKQVSSTNKPIRITKYGKTDTIIMSVPIVEIAKRLGRHRSTIHRELKRNSEVRKPNSLAALPYQAISANNLTMMR